MKIPCVVGTHIATKSLKNGDKITQTQDAVVLEKMISQFLYSKASDTKSENNTDSKENAKSSEKNSKDVKSTELGGAPF